MAWFNFTFDAPIHTNLVKTVTANVSFLKFALQSGDFWKRQLLVYVWPWMGENAGFRIIRWCYTSYISSMTHVLKGILSLISNRIFVWTCKNDWSGWVFLENGEKKISFFKNTWICVNGTWVFWCYFVREFIAVQRSFVSWLVNCKIAPLSLSKNIFRPLCNNYCCKFLDFNNIK